MNRAWRRFVADRGAVIGAVLVIVMVGIAVLRPWIARHDPLALDLDHGLSALGAPLPPSADAPLGTDALGRDVWARVAAGAGNSLAIASLATMLAMLLGVTIGLVAGYSARWIDNALMRLVDLMLAFPFLLVAILLAALFRNAGLISSTLPVVLTLGVIGWTTPARLVRARALVLARSDAVLAARALGATSTRIITRHMLPNMVGLVATIATLEFAQFLVAESVLSFLGLGPQPPAPTWGRMLFEGRGYYRTAPWLVIAPGVAIFVAVVAFNLLGEGLRDAVDPKGAR